MAYICCFVESCLFLLWHSPFGVVLYCYQKRSGSFRRFPFLNHVQVFSCEISLVCHLSIQLFFLPFLFSDYHHEFSCSLVHCWSSFLVHFKHGLDYLSRRTTLVFIPLMRILQCSFVLSSFFVLLRYSFFLFFFHLLMFNGICFQYSQVLVGFHFSVRSDFFLFRSSIPFVICRLPLFIISLVHFSMANYIPISWQYILSVLTFPILSHFWQTVWYRQCKLGRWCFSCDSCGWNPPVYSLGKWLSGIIAITNCNGDSAFPWKIFLWIFISVKLFPSAVSSPHQFSMVFSVNFIYAIIAWCFPI